MSSATTSHTGVRHRCPYITLDPGQLARVGDVLPEMWCRECVLVGLSGCGEHRHPD